LIELAVTLTVLMLAAVVAVPSFIRFQQASQLQWAVRRVMVLAGEARGLAVSGDSEVRLEYDPQAHGMRMVVEQPDAHEDTKGATGAPGAEPPVGERRTSDTRFLPLPFEVSLKLEQERLSETTALRFYPDGRSDARNLRLEEEGFPPVVLTMNPRTGRLRIEERIR
jgi:Tfp pilus assembly protein FimT